MGLDWRRDFDRLSVTSGEAMTREVEVPVCSECPLVDDDELLFPDKWCNHPDRNAVIPSNATRPDDCPLLKEPITIKAKR